MREFLRFLWLVIVAGTATTIVGCVAFFIAALATNQAADAVRYGARLVVLAGIGLTAYAVKKNKY